MTVSPRRAVPGAYRCKPNAHNPDRKIMVVGSRGDYRITDPEAYALIRDLLAAVGPPGGSEAETCVWCRAKPARLLLCEPCKLKLAGA